MELLHENKTYLVSKEEIMEALGFPDTATLIDIFETEKEEGYKIAVEEEVLLEVVEDDVPKPPKKLPSLKKVKPTNEEEDLDEEEIEDVKIE